MINCGRILFIGLLGLTFIFGGVKAQSGERAKHHMVQIDTEHGKCVVALYNLTPAHRDNFIRLVKARFFDTLTFNRIIKHFVVQGGDTDWLYAHKDRLNHYQHWMKAELHESLFHKRGALGMGRDDNAAKDSFTTQFYLVTGKTWTDEELNAIEKKNGRKIPTAQREVYKTIGGLPYLDGNYTVFGEVLSGMDVFDKLSALPGDKNGTPDKKVWMKVRVVS